MAAWIGVDFDGTISRSEPGAPLGEMGVPIPAMVELVKQWHAAGIEVRIMTARANDPHHIDRAEDIRQVQLWCLEHLGFAPAVTASKDFEMWALFDDRAVSVERNTGVIVADSSHVHGTLEVPMCATGRVRDETGAQEAERRGMSRERRLAGGLRVVIRELLLLLGDVELSTPEDRATVRQAYSSAIDDSLESDAVAIKIWDESV